MLEALWWLLQPSSVLVALLLLAFVSLRRRWLALARSLLGLVLLAVLALLLLPVGSWLTAPLEARVPAPTTLPDDVDGLLVLGGALDWRVASARDQLVANAAAERLMAAAGLARRYPEARLVFTGIFGDQVPHDFQADADAQSFFFGAAFASREIVFLGGARSTYEDALLALETLEPKAGERWLLITSALHMPRALTVFETLGWSLTPYPVDYRTAGGVALLRPRPDLAVALTEVDLAVREWGALLVYRLMGRIE